MQHRCCTEGIPFAGLVHGCSEGVLISAGGSEGSLKEKGPMKSILNSPTADPGTQLRNEKHVPEAPDPHGTV